MYYSFSQNFLENHSCYNLFRTQITYCNNNLMGFYGSFLGNLYNNLKKRSYY